MDLKAFFLTEPLKMEQLSYLAFANVFAPLVQSELDTIEEEQLNAVFRFSIDSQ